jgi:hypothetical protein
MNNQVIKNWVDDSPITGIYLVKDIRFEHDGKSINDCLHATQFAWQELNRQADDTTYYNNETDSLLAYYRMQAFLYFDCKFKLEYVRDEQLKQHLLEINNLFEKGQPYDYNYDLGLNYETTDELVEFLYPSTWLAVIPDGYEFCLSYIDDPVERTKWLDQAVYEYLIHTLPVNIFSKAHCLSKTCITNPNDVYDLAGFDIPVDTEENFKRFVVNNAFSLPTEFLYDRYKAI